MFVNIFKSITKKILKKIGWKLIKISKPPEPNPYSKLDKNILNSLNNCTGILHLGAHRGLEAEVYNWFGKKVVWVEALPKTFEYLVDNLYFYKNQIALNGLLSDEDNQNINFNISNYDAACSSIFEFTEKIKSNKYWSNRNHKMVKTIKLKSVKLDTLLEKNKIKPENYNHWILDLQGAELLALKGGKKSLEFCKSIYIEVSKINFYSNGVLWDELRQWLTVRNFHPLSEPTNDEEDVLFVKKII